MSCDSCRSSLKCSIQAEESPTGTMRYLLRMIYSMHLKSWQYQKLRCNKLNSFPQGSRTMKGHVDSSSLLMEFLSL